MSAIREAETLVTRPDLNRSQAARRVLDLLEAGHRHVHVQGPPGFGKNALVDALAQALDQRAVVVRLADAARPKSDPLERVWDQVKGSAPHGAAWVENDWPAGWERILTYLRAGGEPDRVFVLAAADHLFSEDAAHAWPAELAAVAQVVTVSLAPLHLISSAVSRELAERITVRLTSFPPPNDPDDFDETDAGNERWNAQDRPGYIADGKAWLERYIASRPDADLKRGALQRVFALKYEQGRGEVWDGHPLVNIWALTCMLDGVLAGGKASDALDRFRADLLGLRLGASRLRLLPFTPGEQDAVSPLVAEAVADAVACVAQERVLDDRQRQWLLASGWCQPNPGSERLSWTKLATLFVRDPESADGRGQLIDWARATALAARQARRALAERRHQNDTKFRIALDTVEVEYCDSEIGVRRDMRVERADSRTIVPEQMYSFRLSYIDTQPVPDGDNEAAPPERVYFDILVFETQGEGQRFWRHHVRILSVLGRMRHPALIAFRRGGELRSEANDPAPLVYVEIERTHERIPANKVQDLISLLQQPVASDGESTGANPIFQQIVHLGEALDLVHAQGILHRALDFSALALNQPGEAPQLVLTGFEYSTNLRSELLARQWNPLAAYRQAPWNLACRPPGSEWHPGSADDIDPSIDVYAFGALATMLATGLPSTELMWEVDALLPIHTEQLDSAKAETEGLALEAARKLLHDDILRPSRWAVEGALGLLRRLLAGCLDIDPAKRPTMEDLAPQLREWHGEYLASFTRAGNALHVSYPHDQMAKMVIKLGLVDENQRLEGPEGEAWLRTKVQEWVNAAKWMHYRESGFPKQGDFEADRVRKEAQFIFAGPGIVFFASLYRDRPTTEPDHRVLWLAYAMRRNEIVLPDPDNTEFHSPRASKEEVTWIPRPAMVKVVSRSDIASLPNPSTWKPTTDLLIRRGQLASRERRLGREAATVWRIHRDIQLALEAIRSFPVRIEQEYGSESGVYLLQLDENVFRRLNEQGPHSFLRQVILEQQNLRGFFANTVQSLSDAAGPNPLNFLLYPRTKGGRRATKRVVGSIILPVMDDKVRMRLDPGSSDSVPSEGRIVWFDSFGTEASTARQGVAIDRLERRSWLMDFIVSPQDCGWLKRPISGSCGGMLEEAGGESLKELQDRVQIMLSSDPLHAVQGPPGTGKTTLIAALVAEVLRAEDGSRLLVTSQSHAATDNVLLSIMDALKVISRREGREDEAPTTAIRLFSETTRDSVDPGVRRDFSINAQVRAAQTRMKDATPSFDWSRSKDLKMAQEHLHRAAKDGYLEIRFKIERSSPLVFATTGAAMTSIDYLKRGAIGYDYVLIDEAAKAWAVDLVQPLALADRAILVGDQAQLPPFGEQDMHRILENARRRRGQVNVPPDLDYLLDESNEDDGKEAPFERMKGWLKPFHRLFDKRPPGSFAGSNGKSIPLTQSLDRQFRSVPAIGSLVSNTFYRSLVIRNSGPTPELSRRLSIPLLPDQARYAPAIVWIDTSELKSGSFYSRPSGPGMLRNEGEAKLLTHLIKTLRPREGAKGPWECLRVLSPYKAQVNHLKNLVPGLSNLGSIGDDLSRLVQTVDGSQGSEADIVAISLCRRLQQGDEKPLEGATVAARREHLKHQINAILGFLQSPERMNVLMSRARYQLILIGDFSYFARGAQLMDERMALDGGGSPTASFWTRLQGAFTPFDAERHLHGEGLEQPTVLPAAMIVGAPR